MSGYIVTWVMDIDTGQADSPFEAAEAALKYQRDPESQATVFRVDTTDRSRSWRVDLTEETVEDLT